MQNADQSKFKECLIEHILSVISESNGMRGKDLEKYVWHTLLKRGHELNDALASLGIQNLVEELVQIRKVIEIEYILPSGSLNSFYLPAKTQINLRGQETKTFRV